MLSYIQNRFEIIVKNILEIKTLATFYLGNNKGSIRVIMKSYI